MKTFYLSILLNSIFMITTYGQDKVNTWVKVNEVKTGGRASTMMFYDAKQKLFYLTGGAPGHHYGRTIGHYDTETFSLKDNKWENAYPEGSPYKVLSGMTDAPKPKAISRGHILGKDASGATRILGYRTAYATDTRAHFQWAYDTDTQNLYAYLLNKTIAYDVTKRSWRDTKAPPFSKGNFAMVWGNFCYDAHNKEILSIGGSSKEKGGTPGTTAFNIKANKWEKVVLENDVKDLQAKSEDLYFSSRGLLGAIKNRFHLAESLEESSVKLKDKAGELIKKITLFNLELNKSTSSIISKQAFLEAHRRNIKAIKFLESANDDPSIKMCDELKQACNWLWQAARAIDIEPFGRAHSQMVYHAKEKKVVLFGGSSLDFCLTDTWVYDVVVKKWEQKFPELSPSPRTGHAMTYLTKGENILLFGGYTLQGNFATIPNTETWLYQLKENKWSLLNTVPFLNKKKKRVNPGLAPTGNSRGEQWSGGGSSWVMASTDNDEVVSISTGKKGRSTWTFKVDASAINIEGTKQYGVSSGSLTFSFPPEIFEKKAGKRTDKLAEFVKALKPNQWKTLPKAPKLPHYRAWNTIAYDSNRHQLISWGGGHVTYMGTEVSHYSLRTAAWSTSWNPSMPFAPTGGYYVKANLTFHGAPQVPVHAYQAYAFDPPSGNMLYLNHLYRVDQRRWDPIPTPGFMGKGNMKTLVESTPTGIVALSSHGLYQYKHESNSWKKLSWKGKAFGDAWCDGHALSYDSKRDVLWAAKSDEVFKYDMKTGTVNVLPVARPKVLGKWALWREQVYVPELDKLLLMRRFKGPDETLHNVLWDPETQKYSWAKIPFNGQLNGKTNFSWSNALHYDSKYKVGIIARQKGASYIIKFDKESFKIIE